MSWIQKLYETYNNCDSAVGYSTERNRRPLLPICHVTAQAHIEVILDDAGNFMNAELVTDEDDATTIIPATEGAAGRAGIKPETYPLCGGLQYVAGDFEAHGGTVTSGFAQNPKEPYEDFVKLLRSWCESEFSHPKALAVLKYVQRKTLVRDLINSGKLFIGEDGKLLRKRQTKKDKKATKDIFDLTKPKPQDKAFVRWIVETKDNLERETWKDKTLWERWSEFYLSTKKKELLCYVTGKEAILAAQHPKYIRARGDGAKIISSNDTKDFTFRGRFHEVKESCCVSLEVSQKAHNALIWLIDRQGKVIWVKGDNGKWEPGLTVVAWATSGNEIPKPTDDTLSVIGFDDLPNNVPIEVSTAQEVAIKFRERMLGYASSLGKTDNVIVMGLDSASKGRLAITYYREDLSGSDFLKRIEDWHKSCEWIHEYRYKDIQDEFGKKKRYYQPFIGAPAPINVAEAAYGDDSDDRLKKTTVARLLPCIMDGNPIPWDIVNSAVSRACNRIALKDPKDKNEREWNKTLSIACSLYKNYSKEEYNMALDESRNARDYLYGRLLAIGDRIEGRALGLSKESRDTNAARYMQQFSVRPFNTWTQIELSLTPYLIRLGGRAKDLKDLLDSVMCKFDPEEFKKDEPLSGEFLLGYHCQRAELKPKPKGEDNSQNETTDNDDDN